MQILVMVDSANCHGILADSAAILLVLVDSATYHGILADSAAIFTDLSDYCIGGLRCKTQM